MYDSVITGGVYPDFENNCFTAAVIAVQDGRIAALEEPDAVLPAKRTIDASGCIVSPGWIDLHMHEDDFSETSSDRIGHYMRRMGVTTCVAGNCGSQAQACGDLIGRIGENGGAPLHYVVLAGYNSLRESLGIGRYEEADQAQRLQLREMAAEALAAGASGLSFGLEYHPGISTEEMTEIVQALADQLPFVSVHFRSDCDGCMDSLEELACLSRTTGVKVQISHIGSLAANGRMEQTLSFLEQEMADNPLLGFDVYPYAAFSTSIGSAVFDDGWREKWGLTYGDVLLLYPPYVNQRADEGTFSYLREHEPRQSVVVFAMNESEVAAAIAHPLGQIGSDGGIRGNSGHPRLAGTFPRVLAKYVREEGHLSLIDALRKMTVSSAERLGLTGKGVIAAGMDADLTIFDPQTIRDCATFTDPLARPEGIRHVLIGGTAVLENGMENDVLPGTVLQLSAV